ncbi:PREDICTED: probable mitochondrial import inner membrane translocase subunit TIM21 [Camelina sativa]|uniref:Mitochondrial import inner membrane translocase subunit Tim21 n=1 Tax=Camelina sativa TaxID=90675 RepID=A0ABM0THG5_CAMSA|nr:PREDICTED: probable mitochondrial import inner membrane translocase subunit TIM21 [Camelina sativa]
MMMMNLLRRSALVIGRQSKSKLTSFSSSASSQPSSGIPKSLISVLQRGASRQAITGSGLSSLDSAGANGLLFRPQASICTQTRLKKINSSYLTRSFASTTSKEPGNQQNKAKKEVTTVEDPFDSPTYHIPEKPVTFTEGASYSLVILAGLGVAGAAGYGVFKELIFQPKEYKIFDKALKRIQDDGQVRVRIGSPIKGYGQETRNRAARQRIPNRVFTDEDGVEHVEVNFYIRGTQGAGKVYTEMFKDKAENEWKYTYLIVEILTPSPAKLMLESYLPA